MQNQLIYNDQLPKFSEISPENIEPALKQILTENRNRLNSILNKYAVFTWHNLMLPMEEMEDRLTKFWAPVAHLHAVLESDALRAAYNACIPLLTEYQSELMQNEKLYRAMQSIADSPEYQQYNQGERKVIENELRDFRLAGVSLPPQKKFEVSELQKKLTKLSTRFAENILDATSAWDLHITDKSVLKDMPESALSSSEHAAQSKNMSGWVFTLEHSSYAAVMKYLSNRELRWLMYEAYTTRASDAGPNAGRFDNTKIMEDILQTRHQFATCLGFKNYTEYSLSTKMAKTPEQVLRFLHELVVKSKHAAENEMEEIKELAKKDGIDHIEAWDVAYYTEKCRLARYAISQEDLRPYFPINKVLSGMFSVVHSLFGIQIIEKKGVDTWHPQVQFFEVYDSHNNLRGYFYTDFYARAHKREGAWMDECRVRRRLLDGSIQNPAAFLTCNFARPIDQKPALLTHEDVQTLFHEFGHTLHHILTQIEYAPISGINGVAWDAVEFPSQFLEQWCFEKEVLSRISSHHITGESLPDALFNKLIAAKNFQSGMQMLRQLEFALFDFRVHLEWDPAKGPQVQKILDEVRKEISVIPIPKFNRFQHSFSHIFAGAYASGYYSYKWAEVLSSDAFEVFLEKGIFNGEAGQSFLKNILEKGGIAEPMDLFIAFRGREPTIEPLLKQSGLL